MLSEYSSTVGCTDFEIRFIRFSDGYDNRIQRLLTIDSFKKFCNKGINSFLVAGDGVENGIIMAAKIVLLVRKW